MNGLENLTDRQFGTLRAIRMVKRNPEPVYATRCERCGAESTATHTRLRNGAAVCRNSTCGKTAKPTGRDLLREQRRIAAEHEAEQTAAEQAAADARMSAETADWERPERYAPAPSKYQVMTERERLALREFREAEEQAEAERLRPIREAEERAAAEQAHREQDEADRKGKQTAYWREWILTDRDPQVFVSTEMRTASLPSAKVEAHNLEAVNKFVAETPEFSEYRTPENAGTITDYLERNGIHVYDAPTLKGAFVRLRDLGILAKPVAPKPTPTLSRVNLRISDEPKPTPQADGSETGIDWTTGLPLTLTKRQIQQLSSTEYRRFKKLDGAALSLRPLSPLYRGDDEA